jgi:outer membrane protein TolC
MIPIPLLVTALWWIQDPTPRAGALQDSTRSAHDREATLDVLDDASSDASARRRLPVTVEQCVQLAERNSLLLRADEIDVQIAKGEVGRALGFFDTVYFLSTSYSRNHDPVARVVTTPGVLQPDGTFSQGTSRIEIEPIVSEDWRVDTGFRGTLVSGATYSVDLAYTKSETERPDPGPNSLDPSYRTDVGASISQPLLRGAGTTVTKANLLSARNTLRGAAHALEESRIQRAAETIAAYWDYYFARRNLETRELLVEQSSQLVEINKKKKAVGTMITLDVLEAQSELAQRQQELIVARNEIERSADALKRLIFDFEDRSMWDVELVPLTDASAEFVAPQDWNDAARVAIERRPELARRREFLKNNDIAIVVAENSVLPRLDLDASLRFNQLAGSKGQALNYDDDLYTLAVGFTLEVPIGNRSARAERDIARLQKLQALIEYKDAENQVIQDVRNGVREVLNSQKEIEAAHEAVRLASQRFAQLIERRGVGNATTFDVREAQTSWREAIDSETRALFNYEVAKTVLEAAKGTLLERYGILASPMPSVDERVGVFSGP